MAETLRFLQFVVLFVASYWSLLFLVPLKAAHYAANGRLVVRRIFLGNVLAGLLGRRLRRSGTKLILDIEQQPAIVGGPAASASLVQLLVVPWVDRSST